MAVALTQETLLRLFVEEDGPMTVMVVASKLGISSQGEDGARLSKALLHLSRTGRLSRRRPEGRFEYSITPNGMNRLKWLESQKAQQSEEDASDGNGEEAGTDDGNDRDDNGD